jgi:uncharacterized protein (TIGR00730 family)
MTIPDVNDEKVLQAIKNLINRCEGTAETFEGELVTQLIQTSLKLYAEKHDLGQLKLMNRTLKEMRHAYRVFNQYTGIKRVSIFGSARTPEDHPDYIEAKAFSSLMASQGWMCITGGANGIMKAAMEGSEREHSFGLSIRLPFESPANEVIAGDSKSIIFRYFFTRKLMFMSHSDAVAVFPGGYGTMDETFEVLTLLQTGKSNMIPVVLLEGKNANYWEHWERYAKEELLRHGWISLEDLHFYYKAPTIEDAMAYIQKFYKRYHSQRYVKNTLVLRLKEALTENQVNQLNEQFSSLLESGKMSMSPPFPEETDHLNLPRLVFVHNRRHYGLLRALINEINAFD